MACAHWAGAGDSAAFPSLERGYLHCMLEQLRVPTLLRWAIRPLYADQRCCLALSSGLWPRFGIAAGIRQARSALCCSL